MKRTFCIALVFALIVLIFCGPLAQPSKAFAVSAVVVSAVIAALAASGIALYASGLTADQIYTWVSDKIETWASSAGSTVESLIPQTGIGTTISGLLVLGTAAAQGIRSFISWLQTEEDLQNYSQETVIKEDSSFMGVDMSFVESGVIKYWESSGGAVFSRFYGITNVYGYYYEQGDYIHAMLYSEAPFSVDVTVYRNDYEGTGTPYTHYVSNANQITSSNVTYYNFEITYRKTYSYQGQTMYNDGQGLKYQSGRQTINTSEDVQAGASLRLHTGAIHIPTIGSEDKWFLDVGAEAGSTVTEISEGIAAGTVSNTLTASGEVAVEEPTIEITGAIPVLGLNEVFPFCIPFDIYRMVSCLAADPQAPHFTWRFYVPGICDETIDIDLAAFNTAAQILRTMELLLFCVGLAFVTRSHIIRS